MQRFVVRIVIAAGAGIGVGLSGLLLVGAIQRPAHVLIGLPNTWLDAC